MNIIFMGSPEFAVPSLEKLHASRHTIQAVVTNVDKRRGRGGSTSPTPVKQRALELGLPVIEVQDLKSDEFKNALTDLSADLFVVVAFRVLPKHVLEIPKIGSVNLHASLLPKYRGAAPIHWAVMNGEEKTGCTIFFLDEKVDTGKIILQKETEIGWNENTGQVYERLMHLGSNVLLDAIELIDSGDYNTINQDDKLATPAPKLFKEQTHLIFDLTVDEVHNKIRGLSPFPTAWAMLDGYKINFYEAKSGPFANIDAGEILIKNDKLLVGCKDGTIELLEIQLPGKKRMKVSQFLKGNSIEGQFR
ncbi:MAG: methionyl-tRNA formyltransferase [Balneolaceae bacterium]